MFGEDSITNKAQRDTEQESVPENREMQYFLGFKASY